MNFAAYSCKQVLRFAEIGALSVFPENRKYQIGYNYGALCTVLKLDGFPVIKTAVENKEWTILIEFVKKQQAGIVETKESKDSTFLAVNSALVRAALALIANLLASPLTDYNKIEVGYLWGQAHMILGGPKSMWWDPLKKYIETADTAPVIKLCETYSAATKV